MSKLPSIPLFSNLSPDQLIRLEKLVVEKDVPKGQILFLEGATADGLYLIAEGLVKIFRSTPDGREAILHILRQGDVFAEVPTFQGGAFPASAMALDPSRILFLPRRALVEAIGQDPGLALAMLAAISQRLRELAGKVESLTLMEAPQRLAAYLLYMIELNGNNEFQLEVSRGLLAGMLGSARETLSRCLTRLEELGAVRTEGRKVIVQDKAYLETLAQGLEKL